MGKMKEKELEEQEEVAESEVIEAPESINGEVPTSNEQEVNAEQEEVAESEVIEAPESINGEVPASNEQEINAEQEEVAENEVIEAPEDITGEVPAEDKQEEAVEVKYKAKVCIYYGNKKIMPGEILLNVEANTIHSLLKNGFIELV